MLPAESEHRLSPYNDFPAVRPGKPKNRRVRNFEIYKPGTSALGFGGALKAIGIIVQ